MQNKYKILLTGLALVLVTVGVVAFVSREKNKSEAVNIPLLVDSDKSDVKDEISVKYPDFPILYGDVYDRSYQKTPEGYRIESTVGDSVSDSTANYLEEFEEDGWEVITPPDISNDKLQTFSLKKGSVLVDYSAKEEDGEVDLVITIKGQ